MDRNFKIFSQKLSSLSSLGNFHLCNFFSKNSTSFNSVSSYSCCSVSFVLSSSLLIHSLCYSLCSFSLRQIFFQKLFNFFYRKRLFGFDGLCFHLPVDVLYISLKYFILPIEFRPFFNSSNYLWLDLHFLFYSFFCCYYIIFIFQFVFSFNFLSLPGLYIDLL